MKIIQLTASNVKRLKAVEITPDGNLQVIGGKNGQGKSSVLDAIWLALGGGKAGKETAQPIRDGEEKASVTLDMGELIVTRSWTKAGTQLTVTNAEGATYKSPQGMLDALVGQLSFDPLAFTRLSAREQRDALLDLVELGVDLDELDAERQAAYENRTSVGRIGKSLGEVQVNESLPIEEQSASQIIAEIQEAQEINRRITEANDAAERLAEEVLNLEKLIADKRSELQAAEKEAAVELTDTAELKERLRSVESTNAAIRANNDAKARKAQKDRLRRQYEEYTQQIETLDKQKADALAKAQFPVEGLAFDEHGVTYQGVPFSQASSAEQIRASLAIAIALNPKLRVLRILDGSLLDEDSLALIREQVADQDFQVWVERVGDADEGAVILEDGSVRA
ncbi:AAA family ATPase [Nesterenkonia populi]|uniref:AAA family ATPase n=1 Tax=Nesterenkonia populi TaxID=1591087 RepID=UPI0011BD8B01|nr:AAA family ATPase [Nesterenkonia populi]